MVKNKKTTDGIPGSPGIADELEENQLEKMVTSSPW